MFMVREIELNLATFGFHYSRNVDSTRLLQIAKVLGKPAGELRSSAIVRKITPQPLHLAKPNTLSSRFGEGEFPFHTDTAYWEVPAKYVLLHCESPGSGARPTILIDIKSWDLTTDEKSNLCSEVWQTINGKVFLCTVMSHSPHDRILRFDEACMRPVTRRAFLGHDLIRAKIGASRKTTIRWGKGDLLVIDNHRLLHARGAANKTDRDRILNKILVVG